MLNGFKTKIGIALGILGATLTEIDAPREALGGVPLFDVPDFLITVVLALAGALAAFGIYDKIDRTSKGEQ